MNWDDVRIFLSVARSESLSASAGQLGVDAATVGRRILRLEQALGVPLFTRSPRGYALTDRGLRLLAEAEAAEAAMLRADTLGKGEEGGALAGQVRIGAPDGCANYLLPQVCARIAERHPALELQIVALPRVFNLSRREADLVIGVSQPAAGRLRVRKITDYRLCLAASRDYLARMPDIGDVSDLGRHRVVGYIPDMIFDKELDYLGEIGLSGPVISSNSVSVQFNLVRCGAGLGIVHAFALPGAEDVQPVLAHQVRLTRSFYLIRHEDDARAGRLDRLADMLSDGLKQEVAELEASLDRSLR